MQINLKLILIQVENLLIDANTIILLYLQLIISVFATISVFVSPIVQTWIEVIKMAAKC